MKFPSTSIPVRCVVSPIVDNAVILPEKYKPCSLPDDYKPLQESNFKKVKKSEREEVMSGVDSLLAVRLRNELALSEAIEYGLREDKMTVQDAAVVHSRMTPVPELIKIKQLMGGLPTENKQVTYTIDRLAIMDAVREARMGRVSVVEGRVDGDGDAD